jgi:hypothetical protein
MSEGDVETSLRQFIFKKRERFSRKGNIGVLLLSMVLFPKVLVTHG